VVKTEVRRSPTSIFIY